MGLRWILRAHTTSRDPVLARMPSEQHCLSCGCVKARHPAGYCTFHGPAVCKHYRGLGSVLFYGAWCVILVVWTAALVQAVRAYRA